MRFNLIICLLIIFFLNSCTIYNQGNIDKGGNYSLRYFDCYTKSKGYFKFIIPENGIIKEIKVKTDTVGADSLYNEMWQFHLYEDIYDTENFYIQEFKDSVVLYSKKNKDYIKLFDIRNIPEYSWNINEVGTPELSYMELSLNSSKKIRKLNSIEYIFSLKRTLSISGRTWQIEKIGYTFGTGVTSIGMRNVKTNVKDAYVECRCYK